MANDTLTVTLSLGAVRKNGDRHSKTTMELELDYAHYVALQEMVDTGVMQPLKAIAKEKAAAPA